MVNDIIAEVFTTNEFKEEITRQVIAQVLKKGLID